MPPPPHVSALTDHLGFWLRMVSNHVSHAFAARLVDRGVTVAEWSLMRTLYDRAPASPSRIADEMGLTKGAITRLADRLIAKALAVREASAEDGRAQTLALTPAGITLVPELATLADLNDTEFFQALSSAERKSLERTLRRIAERNKITSLPVA